MSSFREDATALTYGVCERMTTTTPANAVCLSYCGESKLDSFALIITQTFVGGNIGYGKAGEFQCPTYAELGG